MPYCVNYYKCPNEKEELNNCKAPDHETERLVKKLRLHVHSGRYMTLMTLALSLNESPCSNYCLGSLIRKNSCRILQCHNKMRSKSELQQGHAKLSGKPCCITFNNTAYFLKSTV